jgi:hypothetical protein
MLLVLPAARLGLGFSGTGPARSTRGFGFAIAESSARRIEHHAGRAGVGVVGRIRAFPSVTAAPAVLANDLGEFDAARRCAQRPQGCRFERRRKVLQLVYSATTR